MTASSTRPQSSNPRSPPNRARERSAARPRNAVAGTSPPTPGADRSARLEGRRRSRASTVSGEPRTPTTSTRRSVSRRVTSGREGREHAALLDAHGMDHLDLAQITADKRRVTQTLAADLHDRHGGRRHPLPLTPGRQRLPRRLRRTRPPRGRRRADTTHRSTSGSAAHRLCRLATPAPTRQRSSRPHHSPTRVPAEEEASICELRRRTGWGPRALAVEVGRPHSTVHQVLRRGAGHVSCCAR